MKSKFFAFYLVSVLAFFNISFVQGFTQVKDRPKTSVASDSVQSNLFDIFNQSELPVIFTKIFWIVLILFIAFFAFKLVKHYLEHIRIKSPKYRLIVNKIITIFQVFCWIAVFILVFSEMIELSTEWLRILVISFLAAILIASQEILKDIFSGLYIKYHSLFQAGDIIRISDLQGEIVQTGLKNIHLKTANDEIITITNSVALKNPIAKDYSKNRKPQVSVDFFLPIHVDVQKVKKIASQSAAISRYVYLDNPIIIAFSNEVYSGSSMIKMKVHAYLLDITHEVSFKSEVTEVIISQLIDQKVITA